MAVTLVQHAQGSAQASSVTVTLGSNTTAGNCVVAAIGIITNGNFANTTVSSITLGGSAGNFSQLAADADGSAFIWADPNCAGGQTSVAVTAAAGTQIFADVYEFSGLVSSSVLDKNSTGDNGSGSTSWTSGATATTTRPVEAWIGVVATGGDLTATGPSSPWTNEPQQAFGGKFGATELSGYQITSATGAATYSGTFSVSSISAVAVVTLLAPVSLFPPAVSARQAVKRASTY